jgi:hypothetical protein
MTAQSPPGKPSKTDEAGMKWIAAWVRKNEDITLKELCETLAEKTGVEVSLMAMHRACCRLKLRYKKNTVSRSEQQRADVQLKRALYEAGLESINRRQLIFGDESGSHLGMSRLYGRARGAARIKSYTSFNKGTR